MLVLDYHQATMCLVYIHRRLISKCIRLSVEGFTLYLCSFNFELLFELLWLLLLYKLIKVVGLQKGLSVKVLSLNNNDH